MKFAFQMMFKLESDGGVVVVVVVVVVVDVAVAVAVGSPSNE